MTQQDRRGPGIRIPPPLIAAVVIGCAWLMQDSFPLTIDAEGRPLFAGIAVVALAFLLALIAAIQFLAAKTHLEPWRPTSTVIRHGIFRYSRNPIYLALCIATVGAGLLLNSWWAIIGAPLLAWLLQQFVIRREEAYLESKFGDEYLAYKRTVRRWL